MELVYAERVASISKHVKTARHSSIAVSPYPLALVYAVMNLRVPQNAGNFLTS
jgi:hypothetical protein